MALPWIQTELEAARQVYVECKQQHLQDNQCEKFLEGLARSHAEDINGNMELIINNLRCMEQQHLDARRIKQAIGNQDSNTLTSVLILTPQGPKELTNKPEIEVARLQENIAKITAAHGTPYLQQLQQLCGTTATNKQSQDIVNGSPQTDIDAYLHSYLSHCTQQAPII
jgi:hypothetical protein